MPMETDALSALLQRHSLFLCMGKIKKASLIKRLCKVVSPESAEQACTFHANAGSDVQTLEQFMKPLLENVHEEEKEEDSVAGTAKGAGGRKRKEQNVEHKQTTKKEKGKAQEELRGIVSKVAVDTNGNDYGFIGRHYFFHGKTRPGVKSSTGVVSESGGLCLAARDKVVFTVQSSGKGKTRCASVVVTEFAPRSDAVQVNFVREIASRMEARESIPKARSALVWKMFARSKCAELYHTLVQLLESSLHVSGYIASDLIATLVDSGMFRPGGVMFQLYDAESVHHKGVFQQLCLFVMETNKDLFSGLVQFVGVLFTTQNSSSSHDSDAECLWQLLSAHYSCDLQFARWQSLPLVLTAGELESNSHHNSHHDGALPVVKRIGAYASCDEYMQCFTRLLRENCLAALRTGLFQWTRGDLDPRDMRVHYQCSLRGVLIPTRWAGSTALALHSQRLPCKNAFDLVLNGNLVCIAPNANFETVVWGTVAKKDASANILYIELCTDMNEMGDAAALHLLLQVHSFLLAESPTFYRAHAPALKTLLRTTTKASFPFYNEIVKVQPVHTERYTHMTLDGRIVFHNMPANQIEFTAFLELLQQGVDGRSHLSTSFDSSQLRAILHALQHRVAIIQGPPGTGKTFIGCTLVRLFASMNPVIDTDTNNDTDGREQASKKPILVLTYKNHALDDFLVQCMEHFPGTSGVARIGRTAEGSVLEQRNLKQLSRGVRWPDELHHEVEVMAKLKAECEVATKAMSQAQRFDMALLRHPSFKRQHRSFLLDCPNLSAFSDKTLTELQQDMEDDDPDLYSVIKQLLQAWLPAKKLFDKASAASRLDLPAACSAYVDNMDSIREEEAHRYDVLLEHDNLSLDDVVPFAPELAVQTPNAFESAVLLNTENVWQLTPDQRVGLVRAMCSRRLQDAQAELSPIMQEFKAQQRRTAALRDQTDALILQDQVIVGMTITGATTHCSLLEQLQPSLIIVEEAAEVLEPHLVAALGSWSKHLVMIGDHKQLRPQVECYKLVQECNFGRSLMERLIMNDMPYVMLQQQCRMRHEFAVLLQDIYPQLQTNHVAVGHREAVTCVAQNVFFWTHTDLERCEPKRGYDNIEEARRAVSLAFFFMQQGYHPSQITILGAYRGQVSIIKNLLEKDMPKGIKHKTDKQEELVRYEVVLAAQSQSIAQSRSDKACLCLKLALLSLECGQIPKATTYVGQCERTNLPKELQAKLQHLQDCLGSIASMREKRDDLINSNSWDKLPACYDGVASLSNEYRRKGQLQCAMACVENGLQTLLLDVAKHEFEDPQVEQVHSRCSKRLLRVKTKLEGMQDWLRKRERQGIDVESIDGYQGAENDIIIVSLTRSNKNGVVGYLSELNRRCVAQSRARSGMYFIGNVDTLMQSHHWQGFVASLQQQGKCGECIPLRCCKHPLTSTVEATRASDIDVVNGICRVRCGQQMACGLPGHMCQRYCHSNDGHYDCLQCEHLRREKEKKEKAAKQKMMETSKRMAKEEIARLREQPPGRILDEISPEGGTAREYYRVKDRTENFMQMDHGYLLRVVRVQKVTHPSLEIEWQEARGKLHDPSLQPEELFHGTSVEGVEGITTNGFRLPGHSSGNMFGQGCYFATDSTKSAQNMYTKNSERLLLCDVLMGRTCTIEGLTSRHPLKQFVKYPLAGRVWLDVNCKKVHGKGFDSVYAKRDSREKKGVLFDEMIVYRPEQALPRYIVHFETINTAALTKMLRPMALITPIKATRHFDITDPLQMHYRVAESQCDRMLKHHVAYAANFKISQVDFIYNKRLVDAFENQQQCYDKKYGKNGHNVVIAFHGTKAEHIDSIVQGGFKLSKVGSSTDSGWWGAGVYFSENTATSLAYSRCNRLLLCKLLLGKQKHVTQRCDGGPCAQGFDSHGVQPCTCGCGRFDECVVFQECAMLPMYIVHYTA